MGIGRDVGGDARAQCDGLKVKLTCERSTHNQGLLPCSMNWEVGILREEDEVLTAT